MNRYAYRVLISAPYMQRDIEGLRTIFRESSIRIDLPKVKERLTENELLAIIDKYDGVICGDDFFTSKVLGKGKKLKVIVKWGTGIDSIDNEYAKKVGILIYNTPNAFTNSVADTVVAFILCFARKVLKSNKLMKEGRWEKPRSFSLSEQTIGIIGVGNIGRAVAKRVSAFGARVFGTDIRKIPKEITDKYNIEIVDLAMLLAESDYVSLNCNLNNTSHHLITKEKFDLMKKSAYIINTARGPLIKEEDLIEALQQDRIAGAALDVFEIEPLPKESPLRKMENVLLSSHNANSSQYYWQKVHKNSIEKLLEGLKR